VSSHSYACSVVVWVATPSCGRWLVYQRTVLSPPSSEPSRTVAGYREGGEVEVRVVVYEQQLFTVALPSRQFLPRKCGTHLPDNRMAL
jgi:hypothetical protein